MSDSVSEFFDAQEVLLSASSSENEVRSLCVCVNVKVIYCIYFIKYSKNSKIVKYYDLKQLFSIVMNLK